MNELYIIGNGFDLWHGLPTRYEDFYRFAKAKLSEVEWQCFVDAAIPWGDFEKSLGTFDWATFYEHHDCTDVTAEDFSRSQAYALEDELVEQADNLVNAIQELFHEWVGGIDVSMARRQMKLIPDARYLTFNYTSTLQEVYEIDCKRILHLHGSCDCNDQLIFGHGETMEEEPELDEYGDSNRTMFTDAEGAAKYPFYAFQKPIDDVLAKHREFFDSLDSVNRITVIGHSLSDVDLPYFVELAKKNVGCQWLVYCYAELDASRHVRQLIKCGVSIASISTRRYTSP